jgi:hypothetical protein
MRYLLFFLIIISFSCNSPKTELTAQNIIDKSIIASGVNKVSNSEITFKFRDKSYKAIRSNGVFKYSRSFDSIKDELSNDGFERLINTKPLELPDSIASNYTNSVNSVHYFSVLPFGLNDVAVFKKLLSSVIIKGKSYYKIQITFSENGGGEDFEDVFIYWIDKENFLVDYLAYSYHTNGGGVRFRVLKEQCNRNGIRFVDYHNYKPLNKSIKLIDIDKAYEKDEVEKVSEIILEDIKVNLLN